MSTPVIYEVNLTPNQEIMSEFRTWLQAHVAEMVALPGFTGARILDEEEHSSEYPDTITVHYELENREALDVYLNTYAEQMRQHGLDRFGDRFEASRRILLAEAAIPDDAKCRNCAAPLAGQYCSACGQRHKLRVITLWELFRSLIGDLFELDSRLWRSLLPLVFRPGFLTREYLSGKRAFYTPPLRMYLVLSVTFFLLLSIGSDDSDLEISLNDLDITLNDGTELSDEHPETTLAQCEEIEISGIFGSAALQSALRERCKRFVVEGFGQFLKDVGENIPKMMFFLLPLIALFMKFLYLGSNRYYVEHLLFFVHYHSAFFLMLTVSLLLEKLTGQLSGLSWVSPLVSLLIVIYMPIYLWQGIKNVYGQHWVVRIFKTVFLFIAYFSLALLTLLIGLVLTALAQ